MPTSLNARFSADFSELEKAVAAADVHIQTFEKANTRAAAEVAKMASSFRGDAIIRDATLAAKAVEAIGGASKLTTADAQKLLTTTTAAMDALKRQGAEVPPGIAKIAAELRTAAAETKNLGTASEAALKSTSPIGDVLSKIGPAVIGAFSIGAVVNFGKSLVTMASQIHDTAEQLGISTTAVQELKYAAGQTGTSFEEVTKGIDKLSKNLQDGTKATRDIVKSLGLSFEDLKNKSPDEAFTAIAEAIKQVPDPMRQTQIAMELFGKAGAQLLPAIKEGLVNLRDEAHRVGAVLDTDAINALESFGDKWDQTMDRAKASSAVAIIDISRGFTGMFEDLKHGLDGIGIPKGLLALLENPTLKQLLQKGAQGLFQASIPGASLLTGLLDVAAAGHIERAQDQLEKLRDSILRIRADAGAPVSGGAVDSLTVQLQQARAEIAKFTPEMRAEIAAGEAMGISHEKLASTLSKMAGTWEVSTAAVDLYAKAQKEVEKLSPTKAFTEAAQKAKEYAEFIEKAGGATAFSREQQDQFNKILLDGAGAYSALKKTGDPAYDLILKLAFSTANWGKDLGGPIKNVIDEVIKSLGKLADQWVITDIAIGNYAKMVTAIPNAALGLKEIPKQVQNADDAFDASLKKTTDAYHAFGLTSRAELEQAAIAASANYKIVAESGTATFAQIKVAYDKMIDAQLAATGKLPSLWRTITKDIPQLFDGVVTSFTDGIGKMLSGQESFKEGFLGIWNDIKQGIGNIISDIVAYFERMFIAKITASLLAGGGVWSSLIGVALSSGVQAGVANAAVSGVTQAGVGAATQAGIGGAGVGGGAAPGHTGLVSSSGIGNVGWGTAAGVAGGALAGGIVGWKVGRATGNWQAGVAAGAGTGAAVGSIAGPAGAGVGAVVGAIAGAWGAHKANEDARDQMVKIRAELEKTFGSLDNVRKQAQFVGVDIDKAFANIGRGVKGTAEFNKVVGEFETKWNALDGAMKRYGITLKEIEDANKTPQQLFGEQAKQIQSDVTALTGAGLGKDTVITKMAPAFNELIVAAQKAGTKIPADLIPILARMAELGLVTDDTKNKLLGLSDSNAVDFQKMEGIAKNYGISLEALGPQFQQAKLSASAKQIFDDFTLLQQAGADVGGVLAGMSDEISTLVQNSLKFGTDIPDNMRPLIENLINSGQLLDETGGKITDIGHIKFAAPVELGFDKIVEAINRLGEKLTTDLPRDFASGIGKIDLAAKNAKIQVPVDVVYNDPGFNAHYAPADIEPPPTATGGIVTRPQVRLVGEAGPEAIIPLDRMNGGNGGGPTYIVVNLDGRPIVDHVVRQMPAYLNLKGAVR
jgi:hypothetical protein